MKSFLPQIRSSSIHTGNKTSMSPPNLPRDSTQIQIGLSKRIVGSLFSLTTLLLNPLAISSTLVATTSLVGLESMPAHAQTAPTPFTCDSAFYQVRATGTTSTDPSNIFKIDRTTYPWQTPNSGFATFPATVRALAYNSADNFLYAIQSNSKKLFKIDANGVVQALPDITGIPGIGNPNINAFTLDKNGIGYLWNATSTRSELYKLDMTTSVATRMATPNIGGNININDIGDIAFNPTDNQLYGINNANPAALGSVRLVKIDPNSGVITDIGPTGLPANTTTSVGSVFFDGNILYGYNNAGNFYSFNLTTGAATVASLSVPVSGSDGASCSNSVSPTEIVLSGTVFNDGNKSQRQDSNEPGTTGDAPALKAVVIDSNNNVVAHTIIDPATGTYAISIVPVNGTYSVQITTEPVGAKGSAAPAIVLPPNWVSTGENFNGVIDTTADGKQNIGVGVVDIPNVNFGIAKTSRTISGTVFEDVNYGGGAGRSRTDAAGAKLGGVTVELYNSTGTLKQTTTTSTAAATLGEYSFTVLLADYGDYKVRVVNSTVQSSRPGSTASLLPVQTFRTDGTTGTVNPITNKVGGEQPAKVDPAAGTINTTTLSSLNTATNEVQSLTPVKIGASDFTGLDFGFNFDTIVNTNPSGQGSLYQFITNSNTLGNVGLDQAANNIFNPAAGDETSIFMIPTTGVAQIDLTAATATGLPQITGTNTIIDGRTQTANIGDTNPTILGVGGTVGVDNLALGKVNGPEIEIIGKDTITYGLDIQANNVTIRGIAIRGFGSGTNTQYSDINIGSSSNNVTNPVITGNVIGTTATSFTDPTTNRGATYGIYSWSTTAQITNNLVGFHGRGGIEIAKAGAGTLIENNEVRGNAITDSRAEGTNILSGGSMTVKGNLFADQGGPGIDTSGSVLGGNTYVNNTVTNNGRNLTSATNAQTSGFRMVGTGNTIYRNIISKNYGAGILVRPTSSITPIGGSPITVDSTVKISQNSIFGNGTPGTASGQIGIDLVASGGNNDKGDSPFVTANDGTTTATGGNGLLDYPVFTSAIVNYATNKLELNGYSRPGAVIELFTDDGDPSNFGEGQKYLATFTEGSTDDTFIDTGTSSYNVTVNGTVAGTARSFNLIDPAANKFKFTIPLPAGVVGGTRLTATATIGNATSEFSGVTTSVARAQMLLLKRITAINGLTTNPNDNKDLTQVEPDNDPAATNSNWPTNFPLVGAVNGGKVKPGDKIEYTVYFMNANGSAAKNVKICDRVVGNQTFLGNVYGLLPVKDKDIEYKLGTNPLHYLTQAVDTSVDRAQFDTTGSVVCTAPTITGTNNGTVIIDVTGSNSSNQETLTEIPPATAQPTPTNSYGYFRFTTLVNP